MSIETLPTEGKIEFAVLNLTGWLTAERKISKRPPKDFNRMKGPTI